MCRYPPFRCTCEHTASRANVVYVVNAFLGHGCCKGTSAPTQVNDNRHTGKSQNIDRGIIFNFNTGKPLLGPNNNNFQ